MYFEKRSTVRLVTGKSASFVDTKTSLKRCGIAARSHDLETSRTCFKSLFGRSTRIRPRISGKRSILNDLEVRSKRIRDLDAKGSEVNLLYNRKI